MIHHVQKDILTLLIFLNVICIQAQQEAPSWVDYAQNKINGTMTNSIFNDYSFSGYDFSESEIPDISTWTQVDVTSFGAIPDDTTYDDDAILDAIKSIEASNQPTVLFFPAGKYLVGDEAHKDVIIRVRKSNIVFKGAGSGANGTEIFMKERTTPNANTNSTKYRFQFIPGGSVATNVLTDLTADVNRGDFSVMVENTATLEVDQFVQLYSKSTEILTANTPNLNYTPSYGTWAITTQGPEILELHIIKKIEGNKITFRNPVQLNIPAETATASLRQFKSISNVGVEDILFTSGWKDFPGTYVHNEDQSLDTGWRGLTIQRARDSWIKNCAFKDVTESINLDFSIACTVKNITFSGRGGHVTYNARYSYGVLFENCDASNDSSVHGPGMMRSSANIVVRNSQMSSIVDQSMDCHGTFPYSNLIENFKNGNFAQNGGATGSLPHSGPDLTFWNFTHIFLSRTNTNYNFWNLNSRNGSTFVLPKFVGLQTVSNKNVNINNGEALNELQGVQVYPESLFDAQLQLRLYDGYMSASSENEVNLAKFANDGDDTTRWNSEGDGSGQWLTLDFGTTKLVKAVTIKEKFDRVQQFSLEYWNENSWEQITNGTTIGEEKTIDFPEIFTRKIRISFNDTSGSSVSITEFKIGKPTLGIENTFTANPTKIFPIPFEDYITVLRNSSETATLTIYDLNGVLIHRQETKSKKTSIKNLELTTGVYVLKIESKIGKEYLKITSL